MKNQVLGPFTLISVLSLAIIAASCMGDVDTDPKNLTGRWQMVKVIYKDKVITKPELQDNHTEVEIEFFKNGEVEGTTSTRTFTGKYVANSDSIEIEYSPFTKVGETDWGGIFDDHIRWVRRFSMRNKGLNFKYKELDMGYEEVDLIFKRKN